MTRDGHMRHPIYAGLRTDKSPSKVVVERPRPLTPEKPKKDPLNNSNDSELKLSHLDKIYWPDEGYTKGRSARLLRQHERHPSCPTSKTAPKISTATPTASTVKISIIKILPRSFRASSTRPASGSDSNKAELRYIVCNNKETLLYMVNLGCIELNPWEFARRAVLDKPDYLILDLDPNGRPFSDVIVAAKRSTAGT